MVACSKSDGEVDEKLGKGASDVVGRWSIERITYQNLLNPSESETYVGKSGDYLEFKDNGNVSGFAFGEALSVSKWKVDNKELQVTSKEEDGKTTTFVYEIVKLTRSEFQIQHEIKDEDYQMREAYYLKH